MRIINVKRIFLITLFFSINSLASLQTDLKDYEKKCTELITENFYSQDKGSDLTLKLLQKSFDKKYYFHASYTYRNKKGNICDALFHCESGHLESSENLKVDAWFVDTTCGGSD